MANRTDRTFPSHNLPRPGTRVRFLDNEWARALRPELIGKCGIVATIVTTREREMMPWDRTVNDCWDVLQFPYAMVAVEGRDPVSIFEDQVEVVTEA